jgi:cysteine desulfurase / selenocysteine lyase
VVSVNVEPFHPRDVAERLDLEYGVQVRAGLHCAPWAHEAIGAYPTGTVRFSFGPLNTTDHVDHVLAALQESAAQPPGSSPGGTQCDLRRRPTADAAK